MSKYQHKENIKCNIKYSYKHQFILSLHFTLHNIILFTNKFRSFVEQIAVVEIFNDNNDSLNVTANVGKLSLKHVDCDLPRTHKFRKIFNRNTVKISYCCMENMNSIISPRNKEVLQPRNENYGCNYRKKESFPLDNKCHTPKIIYEGQITNNTNR